MPPRDRHTDEFTLHLSESDPENLHILGFDFCVLLCHFPSENYPALISMLMYSCLHLTSEYVMANYHYTGREIRALAEVLGTGTKGGQLCILAQSPKIATEHLETGGVRGAEVACWLPPLGFILLFFVNWGRGQDGAKISP